MRIFLLSIFSLFILTCDSSPTQSSIIGCTDESACNYDILADEDDGTCTYAEENFDCDGQCIAELDCNDECGGSAVVDECGVCDGSGAIENFDCDGNCLIYIDCSGVCGGSNTSCEDCNGVQNGTAYLDNCGVCDSISANDCVQDCSGTWGGNATYDLCGTCDDNPSNDCVNDCNGVLGGTAFIDDCSQCVGGTTGLAENYLMDECNICNGSGIPESECDCNGNVLDDCGTCGGNNSVCTGCMDSLANNYCSDCIFDAQNCTYDNVDLTIYWYASNTGGCVSDTNPDCTGYNPIEIWLHDINTNAVVYYSLIEYGTFAVEGGALPVGTYYFVANAFGQTPENFGMTITISPQENLLLKNQNDFNPDSWCLVGECFGSANTSYHNGIFNCDELTEFPYCLQP